jgi:hypothetical protein
MIEVFGCTSHKLHRSRSSGDYFSITSNRHDFILLARAAEDLCPHNSRLGTNQRTREFLMLFDTLNSRRSAAGIT